MSATQRTAAALCEPCEQTPRGTALSPPASGAPDPPEGLAAMVPETGGEAKDLFEVKAERTLGMRGVSWDTRRPKRRRRKFPEVH
jgi:hypothetical protein